MIFTDDQYLGFTNLQKWYRKYSKQIIELSGQIGTGVNDLVKEFINYHEFQKREIMYLSYDQKQVLELGLKGFHAYYLPSIVYEYIKIADFDSIPILNQNSKSVQYTYKKKLRKKIDSRYKMIIVYDSSLLSYDTLKDLASFGLPIILLKDPMLIPTSDSYTYFRDSDIVLHMYNDEYMKNPIIYFSRKILNGESVSFGNFDNVNILSKKQFNLYNLKTSDQIITLNEELRKSVNDIFRYKILKRKDNINVVGEKVILESSFYDECLRNKDNPKIKVFLVDGLIGYLTKVNKHVPTTKYVGINILPEFYHEEFVELFMDRHYLNRIDGNSTQLIPDDIVKLSYAYALTAARCRVSHWDKVTVIVDDSNDDPEIVQRLVYTALSKCRTGANIII